MVFIERKGMMCQLANCMDCYDYELPDDLFGEESEKDFTADPIVKEMVDLSLVMDDDDSSVSYSNSEATTLVMTCLIKVFGVEIFGCGTGEALGEEDDDANDNKSFDDLDSVFNSIIRLEHEIDEAEDYEAGSLCGDMIGGMEAWDVLGSGMYQECVEEDNNAPGGSEPEDALFFALGYVGVEGLDVFGSEKYLECVEDNNAAGGSEPPDALLFALGYLGVEDLLSVERVCKSLRDVVRSDPLLWRNIDIGWNYEITDDDLIRLSNRAQGTIRTLSIVECLKVTNRGVKYVLENNLGLTKLSVSSCCSMRVGTLLQDLKVFQSVGMPGIKRLRIGGVPDATKENFNELKLLLGSDVNKAPIKYVPRYHCPDQLDLSLDDDRDIDLEICPKCQEVREVFDCPAESCKLKPPPLQKCRACTLCIERCIQCGCCLDDGRYYLENFSRKYCCLDCISSNGHGKVAIYGIFCRL